MNKTDRHLDKRIPLTPEAYGSELSSLLTEATTGLIERGSIGVELLKFEGGGFQVVFRHGRFEHSFWKDVREINEYRNKGRLKDEMYSTIKQAMFSIFIYRSNLSQGKQS